MKKYDAHSRIVAGIYPAGIVYADRKRERGGDYARLAFLSFGTLELEIEPDCPQELRQQIVDDAARIQARKGEQFQVSTAGQTVLLGSRAVNESRATHFQVYDTRAKSAVRGAECMEYEVIADNIAFRLNLRSRAKSPRYVVRPVDPHNLPIRGT
jgi:hypothetical protein